MPVPYRIGAGDEIVITEMEHHSNIVPWQLLRDRTGATLRWFGLTDEGRLDLSNIDELINERTKVVSVVWVSNMLGTVNPLAEIIQRAHDVGALVIVDAAQAVPQLPVDVAALGADFVAFTGHKMVGPTGIGVLWGRADVLGQLPPFLGGGEMIETVTMQRSTYAGLPHRFEAGTPPIAEAIGLGAAVDYLSALGMDAVAAHEQQITGVRARPAGRRARADGPRPHRGGRPGRCDQLRAGRHPPARRQPGAGLSRDRRPGRASLCAPRPRPLRRAVLDSRVVLPLHDRGEVDALVDGLEYTKRFFKVG